MNNGVRSVTEKETGVSKECQSDYHGIPPPVLSVRVSCAMQSDHNRTAAGVHSATSVTVFCNSDRILPDCVISEPGEGGVG
jgi:hypothetical protein